MYERGNITKYSHNTNIDDSGVVNSVYVNSY